MVIVNCSYSFAITGNLSRAEEVEAMRKCAASGCHRCRNGVNEPVTADELATLDGALDELQSELKRKEEKRKHCFELIRHPQNRAYFEHLLTVIKDGGMYGWKDMQEVFTKEEIRKALEVKDGKE